MHRFILKAANFTVNIFFLCIVCISGGYSIYALWDNHQVYEAAENVQEDMLTFKPQEDEKDSFEELMNINSDVVAWITLDHTEIDYPVLQGESNLLYLNTDVYGEFSLAGSIFLDSRCDRTFQDSYSLVYGHHMANGSMFGDLDRYKKEKFFQNNKTGKLLLPDRSYDLEIVACLTTASSDDMIFEVGKDRADTKTFISYLEQNSLNVRKDTLKNITNQNNPDIQFLAMSTCSSEYSDARTVVVAVMKLCEK